MIQALSLAASPAAVNDPQAAQAAQIQKIRQAAEGFERTLLRQMLQELRTSSLGSSGSLVSQGYAQIGDDHLAEHLARAGGLGLAQAMTGQLMAQMQLAKLIKPA
jgi:Rod binding domain-containing protein